MSRSEYFADLERTDYDDLYQPEPPEAETRNARVTDADMNEYGDLVNPTRLPRPEKSIDIDSMPTKAREYLQRVERNLVNRLGDALSVPQAARRDFLNETAREISKEYFETGTISQESLVVCKA